jgi:TRAP-type C4-dicarboxylate transport system substrate-binding protein
MVPWMERVEELTNGQVEFETFAGGELVSTPDEGDAVLSGTIDVGLVLPIYQPDQYAMAEITMLPLAKSDAHIGSNAWKELLNSDVELADGKTFTELQFGDFKIFPVATTQEYSISTTGKEFKTAKDVKGTSLRTPSRIHEKYSEIIGINSVTMPAVEMYDSLSRGSFDGSYYSIADWSGYGFQDLFKYTVTGVNFGHFNAFIGMSNEKWDSLPKNVQDAMTQANEELFSKGADEWIKRSEEMTKQNEADGGKFVEFSTLDQSVQDLINKGIEDTWEDYAKLLEKQGQPGNKLVTLWRDIIIEQGGDVPDGVKNMK